MDEVKDVGGRNMGIVEEKAEGGPCYCRRTLEDEGDA